MRDEKNSGKKSTKTYRKIVKSLKNRGSNEIVTEENQEELVTWVPQARIAIFHFMKKHISSRVLDNVYPNSQGHLDVRTKCLQVSLLVSAYWEISPSTIVVFDRLVSEHKFQHR